jgi:hypothetical protein
MHILSFDRGDAPRNKAMTPAQSSHNSHTCLPHSSIFSQGGNNLVISRPGHHHHVRAAITSLRLAVLQYWEYQNILLCCNNPLLRVLTIT